MISSLLFPSFRSVWWRFLPTALACGSLVLLGGCHKNKKSMAPAQLQRIGVMTLHVQPVAIETTLPGRTEAYKQAQIRPQVNGVIVSRHFEQGADVKAGQQLYQIFIAPYQAAYQQAKGQLLAAQATAMRTDAQLRRYRPLVRTHAISDQDYDNARAAAREAHGQVEQAKAAVVTAQVNLGYTRVSSPIDGRIGRTLYTEGTLVTANQAQPIAVVTQLDPIYVDVNLAAEDMLRLQHELADGQLERSSISDKDAAVSIELPDGSIFGQKGRLELSEVTVDPAVGTLVLRAILPNPAHTLLPGMYVHAHINEGTEPSAILIMQKSVLRNTRADPYVMVVDKENKVSIRMVTLGRTLGEKWLVTSGLKMGERVVVEGIQRVRDGQKIDPYEVTQDTPHGGAE